MNLIENSYHDILAMIQKAKDIANGDIPNAQIKSDKKAYIAYDIIHNHLEDKHELFEKFVNNITHHLSDKEEDDDYNI
ncbi:hypothetical protein [Candidatus Cytomitobacter primus]|uniref:Uncharacterized protein n=1 Tax=Candidatus Cytomitobacter primus TaxID=2066024 RepID=A0A5C0UF31_9PROT|nr:hypothetical protein [Candidatus Cytomitobacter primus]QEK38320.1 hypothetical protein FZC34_00045 [Candidatus Cytomitobacter primus]